VKPGWILLLLTAFLFVGCEKKSLSSADKSDPPPTPKVILEKEKLEKEQPLPREVKIKLRRDGKDNYSWELSSSDVDQLMKVNEKLRRQLAGEKGQ